MTAALVTPDSSRLEALARYRVLDTPPEPAFDSIVGLARDLFRVPIAGVALLDDRRVWFKSAEGLGVAEIPLGECPCDLTLAANDVVVVEDALADPRTRDRAVIRDGPRIRFYAGAPLRGADGTHLGAFFIADQRPRDLAPDHRTRLMSLATLAMEQLELRAALARIAQTEAGLRRVAEAVSMETSEAFVASLTRCLAEALGADFGYVSEADPADPDIAHCTLFESGRTHRLLDYGVQGTPCAEVLAGEPRCYPRDVAALFPRDAALASLGVEAYAAVPLLDSSRRVMGSLGVLSRRPIEGGAELLGQLAIFGARAGAEMERLKVERRLREAERRRAALFRVLPDMVFHLDREGRVVDFHPGQQVRPLVPPEQFVGRSLGNVIPPDIFREALGAIGRALGKGGVQVLTYELPEAGGRRAYEARLVASGEGEVVCFVRDVTASSPPA